MPDTSSLPTYWNTAREEVGSRREATPIPRDLTAIIYTERWLQAVSAFSMPTLGTEHGSKSGYYLVAVRELDVREGLKTFELDWATIPATRSEPLTTSYTFPGYFDERDPPSLGVFGRVVFEYFLHKKPEYRRIVGATSTASTDVIAASGHPYVDGDAIVFVSGTTFTGLTAGQTCYVRDTVAGVSFKVAATAGGAAIDLTADGTAGIFYRGIPPVEAQRYTNTYGDVMYLNNGGGVLYITSPTLTAYKALVSGGSEIVPLDSELEPYAGDIWCRKTQRIPAR